MTKVSIEFTDVNSKQTAALLALLGGKSTTKKVEDDDDDDALNDDDDDADDDDAADDDEAETPKAPSLEAVREAAQKLIGAGKSAKLKAILKEMGAAKVVDVPKAKFKTFLAKCKAVK